MVQEGKKNVGVTLELEGDRLTLTSTKNTTPDGLGEGIEHNRYEAKQLIGA